MGLDSNDTTRCPTPYKDRLTRQAADAARRRWSSKRRKGQSGDIKVYRCQCGGWHLAMDNADGGR